MLIELGIIVAVFLSAYFLGYATAKIRMKSHLEALHEDVDVKSVVIEKLEQDVQVSQGKVSQLEKELSGSITKTVYDELKRIHQVELDKIEKWLKEQKTQIKTLYKQLEAADKQQAAFQEQQAEKEELIHELEEKLETVLNRMAIAEAKLATDYKEELELPDLQEVIFEREQEIAELRGKIEELEEIISDDNMTQDYGTKNMAIFQHLESQLGQLQEATTETASIATENVDEIEEDLASKAANDPNFPREKLDIEIVNAPYAKEIDDLTELNGIDEYTALKLNAIGIQNFKQISQLTPEAIKQVNAAIKFFPERIARDQWVEQATEKLQKSD